MHSKRPKIQERQNSKRTRAPKHSTHHGRHARSQAGQVHPGQAGHGGGGQGVDPGSGSSRGTSGERVVPAVLGLKETRATRTKQRGTAARLLLLPETGGWVEAVAQDALPAGHGTGGDGRINVIWR